VSQKRANSPELRAKIVESIELSVKRELIAESLEARAGK